jgi:hypothetical protein
MTLASVSFAALLLLSSAALAQPPAEVARVVKSVQMSIHHVFHFNDSDKIDIVVQFLDRAPIAAVLANK